MWEHCRIKYKILSENWYVWGWKQKDYSQAILIAGKNKFKVKSNYHLDRAYFLSLLTNSVIEYQSLT